MVQVLPSENRDRTLRPELDECRLKGGQLNCEKAGSCGTHMHVLVYETTHDEYSAMLWCSRQTRCCKYRIKMRRLRNCQAFRDSNDWTTRILSVFLNIGQGTRIWFWDHATTLSWGEEASMFRSDSHLTCQRTELEIELSAAQVMFIQHRCSPDFLIVHSS